MNSDVEQEEKTAFEHALAVAESRAFKARLTLIAVGRMTERIEKLIDEAVKAWDVVEEMLGDRRSK